MCRLPNIFGKSNARSHLFVPKKAKKSKHEISATHVEWMEKQKAAKNQCDRALQLNKQKQRPRRKNNHVGEADAGRTVALRMPFFFFVQIKSHHVGLKKLKSAKWRVRERTFEWLFRLHIKYYKKKDDGYWPSPRSQNELRPMTMTMFSVLDFNV